MDGCMVYNASDDTLSMELVETFLEFSLRMEGKHMAIPGCGLVILENRCEYASRGSYGLTPHD